MLNQITLGRRKNAGDPTIVDDANTGYETTDGLQELSDVDHDYDEVTGTGYHYAQEGSGCRPMHMKVKTNAGADGVFLLAWWQSADGSWWHLGRATGGTSFVRGDADFYMPTGDILDVPLT